MTTYVRPYFLVVLVVLAAVAARLVFAFDVLHRPANPSLIVINGEAARNFAEGRGLTLNGAVLARTFEKEKREGRLVHPREIVMTEEEKENMSPFYHDELGYPIFLAALWKLTGFKHYAIAQAFQIALAAAATLGVFFIARALFSSLPVAYLAAFFYAFYLPEAKLLALPHQYAWMGPLMVFAAWGMVAMKKERDWKKARSLALGVASAVVLAALMRSTVILLPVLMAPVFFLMFPRRKAAAASIIMLVLFFVVFGAVFAYNSVNFGEKRIVRRTFWHNVGTGIGQFPNPWSLLPTDTSVYNLYRKENPHATGAVYPDAESEEFLKKTFMEAFRQNPAWFAGMIVERIPMALFPFHWAMTQGHIAEGQQNGERYFYRAPYDVWKLGAAFVASVWIALALWGMWLARAKWKALLPLLLIWAYFIGIHSAIFVQPYYMHAVSFVYAIFSAYALYVVWQKLKRKRTTNPTRNSTQKEYEQNFVFSSWRDLC